jgi:hypothetical protein
MEKFHIFIASCHEGRDIQIPRLINNILECNIPVNFVHFIVGGSSDDNVYYQDFDTYKELDDDVMLTP